MKTYMKVILAVIASLFMIGIYSTKVNAAEPRTYHFSYIQNSTTKYNLTIEGNGKVVAVYEVSGLSGALPEHYYQVQCNSYFAFYTLSTDGNSAVRVYPKIAQEFTLVNGKWVEKNSYPDASTRPQFSTPIYHGVKGTYCYLDIVNSGIEVLKVNIYYPIITKANNAVGYTWSKGHKSLVDNVYSYLLNGTFIDMPEKYSFVRYRNGLNNFMPCIQFTPKGIDYDKTGVSAPVPNSNISLVDFAFDTEKGVVSWNGFVCPNNAITKGVIAVICYDDMFFTYDTLLSSAGSYEINLKDVNAYFGSGVGQVYMTNLRFHPYYVLPTGEMFLGNYSCTYAKSDAILTRSGNRIFTCVDDNSFQAGNGNGVVPDDDDSPFSKPDFDITKEGIFDESIPKPVIEVTSGQNFYFKNSSSDYYIEVQGRWYTADCIEPYKDGLLWKYKYSKVVNNSLSTWVNFYDKCSSEGEYNFMKIGKDSFDLLLKLYPPDKRTYYGSSGNSTTDWQSGYSSALQMLKDVYIPGGTIISAPEIYVRYFSVSDDGIVKYGVWNHYYRDLANGNGSSLSEWDSKNEMNGNNQSENGLTNEDKNELEGTGNSKNDSDVTHTIGGSGEAGDASENLWGIVETLASSIGALPQFFGSIFGFLPSWLLGLIGLGIGSLVILRFLGR